MLNRAQLRNTNGFYQYIISDKNIMNLSHFTEKVCIFLLNMIIPKLYQTIMVHMINEFDTIYRVNCYDLTSNTR